MLTIPIKCYDRVNRYKFTIELPPHKNIIFKARAKARRLNRELSRLKGQHKIGWIVVDDKEVRI